MASGGSLEGAAQRRQLCVLKFGGSSVDGAEAIGAVAAIVAREAATSDLVVVVSALRGVTDQLVECASAATVGDAAAVGEILADVRERHDAVAAALAGAAPPGDELRAQLDAHLARLGALCDAVATLGEGPPRARDEIVATGERLAAALVAAALRAWGLASCTVAGERVVVTDAAHGNAAPHLEETRRRAASVLRPLVDAGAIPVVAGFTGASPAGAVTTLGRGGSDLTATLLGYAVAADRVVFFKDVDGILSADPAIVSGARLQPAVSYREARELASLGARCLHPASLGPLEGRSPLVELRNTFSPEAAGTRLGEEPARGGRVVAVVASGDRGVVTIAERGRAGRVAARAVEIASRVEPSALLVADGIAGDRSLSFVVSPGGALALKLALESALEREIVRGEVRPPEVEWGAAVVSVVGERVASDPAAAAAVLAVLGARGIRLRALSRGPDACSLRLVLEGCATEEAVRALHALVDAPAAGGFDRRVAARVGEPATRV